MDNLSMPEGIPIIVELSVELSRAADELPKQIESELAKLFDELGIPEKPLVEVKSGQAINNLRVRLHGKTLEYSPALLRNVAESFSPPQADSLNLTSNWASAIEKLFPESSLGNVLAHLVIEIVKQKPETLFGSKQTIAYLLRCKQTIPTSKPEQLPHDRVTRILRYILSLRLSIANTCLIVEQISEGIKEGRNDIGIAERLVPQLSPDKIEIEMSSAYLHQLFDIELKEGERISVSDDKRIKSEIQELLNLMTDGLFYELGIRVPEVVIVASDSVKPMAFTIKLNHIKSIARHGLGNEQVLVNETAARLLLLNIKASTRINPANGNENALVSQTEKKRLEENGMIVWDQPGYLILALSYQLRRHASCLLHSEIVEYELGQIHKFYPELVRIVVETVPLSRLTCTLRELLREEISIRNLKMILERILTCDYIVTNPSKYIVFDDRLAIHTQPDNGWQDDGHSLAQHVRAGLKQYIGHKYARGQSSLIVYLLTPEIENLLLDHLTLERSRAEETTLSEEKMELINRAVGNEVDDLPPTSTSPVILTSPEIRYFLRRTIENGYPSLPVLSWDELSPNLNIQPIARISLPD